MTSVADRETPPAAPPAQIRRLSAVIVGLLIVPAGQIGRFYLEPMTGGRAQTT